MANKIFKDKHNQCGSDVSDIVPLLAFLNHKSKISSFKLCIRNGQGRMSHLWCKCKVNGCIRTSGIRLESPENNQFR